MGMGGLGPLATTVFACYDPSNQPPLGGVPDIEFERGLLERLGVPTGRPDDICVVTLRRTA